MGEKESVCACVCVCVCERGREEGEEKHINAERERERERGNKHACEDTEMERNTHRKREINGPIKKEKQRNISRKRVGGQRERMGYILK